MNFKKEARGTAGAALAKGKTEKPCGLERNGPKWKY